MRMRRQAFFGAFPSFIFAPTISGVVNNYNVRTAAMAAGWDGVMPLNATVTVTSTGVLLATNTSVYAFTVPPDLPIGSSVRLNMTGQAWGAKGLGNNGGSISGTAGMPGIDGGSALLIQYQTTINNTGIIAGGGGGGGGGGGAFAAAMGGGNDAFAAGGNGGDGAGYGSAAVSGAAGATSNPAGGAIAISGSGGGGGNAGANGNPGIAGSSNNGPAGAGGAAGKAGNSVVGDDLVSWQAVGTLYGPRILFGSSSNVYIGTPAATPASFGAAFEGGYYAGLIWNELVQSTTAFAIGTGTKTFAVPDMTGNPLVYIGQTLEVRSRANPANKMIGTVISVLGTTMIAINVTSVGGSGSASDWSIMSRYRLIVAPKATGENASLAYKPAANYAPSPTGTLTEGRKATLAMVAADTSAVYPAAHWCKNLSIDGKTDWYLPARDELELLFRNLKPTTDANYTFAGRATGATPNYRNLGSYGDTATTCGTNNNSSPVGVANTTGVPAQTAAAAFRIGGSEAFETVSVAYYWSSTEYSMTDAWVQYFDTANPGYQTNHTKNAPRRVRAVRRSII